MKVGIIGLGMVGRKVLLNLFNSGIAKEVYLFSPNEDKAQAEIMDLNDSHGFYINKFYTKLYFTKDYKILNECHFVIINVSIPRKSNASGNRLDTLADNARLLSQIGKEFKNPHKDTKFIIITNPVDLMVQIFIEASGIDSHRVIGTGTYLDSIRLDQYLAEYYHISVKDIRTFVIGEHGDSSAIAWSISKICGLSIEDYSHLVHKPPVDKIKALEHVRKRGLEIFRLKGHTDHGIGAAVNNILESMVYDEKRILAVSTLTKGQYGIKDIVIGLPCIIGTNGIEKILEVPLTPEEIENLTNSANLLKKELAPIRNTL